MAYILVLTFKQIFCNMYSSYKYDFYFILLDVLYSCLFNDLTNVDTSFEPTTCSEHYNIKNINKSI